MAKVSTRLGEMLMASGLIDEWQLMLGIRAHKRSGDYLGESLVTSRFITEKQWLAALSAQLDLPYIDLGELAVRGTADLLTPDVVTGRMSDQTEVRLGDKTVLAAMPSTVARRYGVFPLALTKTMTGWELIIATADPNNSDLIAELSWLLQVEIGTVLATRPAISEAIFRFYGDDDDDDIERMPHPESIPSFRTFRPVAMRSA